MKVYYTDGFVLPLPPSHTFPLGKYAMLRRRLLDEGIIAPADMLVPPAATDEELFRAHDPSYAGRVIAGSLSAAEVREIGLPWSPELVERSRRSTGATIAACRVALAEGIAANLAGGTHHAGRSKGAGYCVFNDAAVAARAMQAEDRAGPILVIDCDVHQGDGTAAIFADDPSVFTLSIHGARNYPLRKPPSDLDVPLPDGADDASYLAALAPALDEAIARSEPDLAIYLAGADPFEGDRLGRMALTMGGLLARDRLVFERCRRSGLPVAVAMAGGYGRRIEETVEVQVATLREAARYRPDGWPMPAAPGDGASASS